MPVVTNAILFNTANADAVVSAMQIFPVTNPWNENISQRPVLANSAAMIAQIASDLAPSRAVLTRVSEMNFVLVPDNQPRVPIDFFNYPGRIGPGRRDVPERAVSDSPNLPIEDWPMGTGTQTLYAMADECRRQRPARHHCGAGRWVRLGNVDDAVGAARIGRRPTARSSI